MSRFARSIGSLIGWLFSLGFTLIIIGGVVAFLLFKHYSENLPDYSQLSVYEPPNISRLYSEDGKLLAEYATQKRVFVPLKAVPKLVVQAFISAEDKNYYAHTGVDITGIARAIRDNVVNYGTGKSLVGGSTITQQVVKNFLLTNEKSIERKAKEAILAIRISSVFSKDKILELYLNEIYLGQGSYGIASAALNYFNKPLEELTIEEAALLAAQPKAPNLYNPKFSYDRALARRNWVIERMQVDSAITQEEAEVAKKTPITLTKREESQVVQADFFAEEVRRQLVQMYGVDALYKGGLVVKTTINPELQQASDKALRLALIDYDRRRGYRGTFAHIENTDKWQEKLVKLVQDNHFLLMENQQLALIVALDDKKAKLRFADNSEGEIPFSLLKWTRKVVADGVLGPEVRKPVDILKLRDVVLVGTPSEEQKKTLPKASQTKSWDLQQIPEVNGGMVVIDPHTGRVLAMSGGYAYGKTEFNRVTQARRQPGSAFKPFVYMAALENGFTPSTILEDGPIEISINNGKDVWKPENYHDDFLGPITLRAGLEKSRNIVTVQLAQMMGIDRVREMAKRLNIYPDSPPYLSMVLGAEETTLMRLANAYGMIVNGGKTIIPSLIERIDDRHGKTIYRRDRRQCPQCQQQTLQLDAPPPALPDERAQLVDERVAYQMVSLLRGVVERGTGTRALEIGKIVAGKTGTTNDSKDTWFVGFSPNLVAGVYIGYDNPHTLGKKETGSSVALPAFISFMKTALADTPNMPFRVPRGILSMKIDRATGLPLTGVEPPDVKVITEAFITGAPIFIPGVTPPSWTIVEDDKQHYDPAMQETNIENQGMEMPPYSSDATGLPPIPALPKKPEAAPMTGTGGLY